MLPCSLCTPTLAFLLKFSHVMSGVCILYIYLLRVQYGLSLHLLVLRKYLTVFSISSPSFSLVSPSGMLMGYRSNFSHFSLGVLWLLPYIYHVIIFLFLSKALSSLFCCCCYYCISSIMSSNWLNKVLHSSCWICKNHLADYEKIYQHPVPAPKVSGPIGVRQRHEHQ